LPQAPRSTNEQGEERPARLRAAPRPAGKHQHPEARRVRSLLHRALVAAAGSENPRSHARLRVPLAERVLMLGIPELLDALKGLRTGAILNPTSVTEDLRHLADVLHERKVLAALFGPEHG